MAKSKSGGSRSFLRGKLGADVYSIGKDGKGKKQQVVRALAETVANPQTQAQMRGRMIMSTIMQAQSALSQLIDHSFDGFPAGQPSISQFIRVNYSLIKADVASHPSASNTFGLAKYGEKGAKGGAYQISDGKAALAASVKFNPTSGLFELGTYGANADTEDLINLLSLQDGDYITMVGIKNDGTASYVRLRPISLEGPTEDLSAQVLKLFFSFEGTDEPTFGYTNNIATVQLTGTFVSGAIIVSRKTVDGYVHNKAIMATVSVLPFTSSVALPTYPVGNAKFLNGGDVPGLIDG